jgi:sporulation protein YlmC with PRC-barrel domain
VSPFDAELLREGRSGVAGHAGSVTAGTKLSRVTDDGHAIHYMAVERGTPVYSSDAVEVGTVEQVVDNYREHILDGIVLKATDGAIRFVDGPEVARTFERAVRLTIPAEEVAQLPPPERGPGSFRPNVRGGRLSRLFGGGWKRG